MKFQIKNRWSGAVQFECELGVELETAGYSLQLGAAVRKAIESQANLRAADLRAANLHAANLRAANLRAADLREADLRAANLSEANLRAADLRAADLREADLRAANLSEANLRAADLSEADLRAANLSEANLRAADLSEANLRAANLSEADLSEANLRAADLRAANLSEANLRAADLSEADLRAADLSEANLQPIRDDFYAVLSAAPAEVPALIAALDAGRVNGSTYSDGECGCLVGTLAIASGADPARRAQCESVHGLSGNVSRPAEQFFLCISKGATPATNQHAAIAREWAQQWLDRMLAAFADKAVPVTS